MSDDDDKGSLVGSLERDKGVLLEDPRWQGNYIVHIKHTVSCYTCKISLFIPLYVCIVCVSVSVCLSVCMCVMYLCTSVRTVCVCVWVCCVVCEYQTIDPM